MNWDYVRVPSFYACQLHLLSIRRVDQRVPTDPLRVGVRTNRTGGTKSQNLTSSPTENHI